MMVIADAICWRTVFSGRLKLAIATIDSNLRQSVAGGVGVNRGHRSFVTRVHRLQHVEGFLAADLADDDSVGTHTQAVDQQLPLADRALPFHVGRPGLQADDVLLLQSAVPPRPQS